MRKLLLLLIVGCLYFFVKHPAACQIPPNAKNVDKTAMSFFDGMQTFRALEYTVDANPNSEKVYRLQTLPENGLPEIILKAQYQGNTSYFEDHAPYDDQFTASPAPYTSAEGVQILYGFQTVLKEIATRFGWKGLDGGGFRPIKIFFKNSDEDNPFYKPVYATHYGGVNYNDEYFTFHKSATQNLPFNAVLELISHEMGHAIFVERTGIINKLDEFCFESRTLEEFVGDALGIYIENKIKKSSPSNFSWIFGEQYMTGQDFASPKSFQYADTYYGENYVNVCSGDFDPHPSSGVGDRWFVLLSDGFQGSAYNDLGYGYSDLVGIGPEKAIQIIWDAIPSIKVYTDYPALRAITLQTAEKLYGLHSTEYIAVQNAWCAVGVCDNNPAEFKMYPANATSNVVPWPTVRINLTWPNTGVTKWMVQTSTKYDFSENVQDIETDNITITVDPNGQLTNFATVDAYYHPGEKVYARAKIIEADPNFCKGLNPLCKFYQQYGPTHAFTLKDQKIQFWPNNNPSMVANPWDKPKLTWKSIDDADRYRIQVATDNAFNNLVYDDVTLHTGNFTESGEINTTLEMGQDYYVRVRAERLDFIKINKNYGAWSDIISLHTTTPQTSITQALNQALNDPPKEVPSLGFWVTWYKYAGASNYVVQAATDPAFLNIVRSQTVGGNTYTLKFLLPALANQTPLYIRVLPQKGATFGLCNNVWRVKTSESLMAPKMLGPANGTNFPFRKPLVVAQWGGGTVDKAMVDHYELWVTEKTFGLTSIFSTPDFDFALKDEFLFDDKQGVEFKVLAVGPLGAKSALSAPFSYNICPDHPDVNFPADLIGKVDALQDFVADWDDSFWFDAGSEYRVTIRDAQTSIPVAGFDNKPTTATSMLVPAGTLINGKNYVLTVKNSSSCAGIDPAVNFFSAVGAGGANQPQPPKLVDFTIELKGFRNDPDGWAIGTSNYRLGLEMIDPDGNLLALVDPNGNQVTQLDVDSENSGVILVGDDKPEGKYKLRLKMIDIFPPFTYYPFDQPFFSVSLNGQQVIKHVITANFLDPNAPSNEFKTGFQFADIILDIK